MRLQFPLYASLIIWCIPATLQKQAQAQQQVVLTVTGTVVNGTDGLPNGTARIFGGGSSLDGEPVTLSFRVSADSPGKNSAYPCSDGSTYFSTNSSSDPSSHPIATLQIGGGSFTLGALPLSSISWLTNRSVPASCGPAHSSAYFEYVEDYGGSHSGQGAVFGAVAPGATHW